MESNSWIYFGIFISEDSKKINLTALFENEVEIPEGWKEFNHHMTVAFNNKTPEVQKLYDMYKPYFGKTIRLIIDGIGVSDEAIAVRVNFTKPIANKIPHITIATPPNGKPVNSNKITEWYDIKPYEIKGKFSYYGK